MSKTSSQIYKVLTIVFGLAAIGMTTLWFTGRQVEEPEVVEERDTTEQVIEAVSIDIPFDTSSINNLHYYLEKMAASRELKHASWSFQVKPVNSDSILAAYNPDMSLVPASVMKIITTGVALDLLDPDDRFETLLQYDGEINRETKALSGNIFIRGGGDPSLGSEVFGSTDRSRTIRRWVNAIMELDIDTINGAIIGDAKRFEYDMIPSGWAWEDMQSGYTAGASGLSFNENIYHITFQVGADTMDMYPDFEIPDFTLVNSVKTGDLDGQAAVWVSGSPYMNKCFIEGFISKDSTRFGVTCQLPDPAYQASHMLYRALQKKGIVVRDSSSTMRRKGWLTFPDTNKRVTFHKTLSPPLVDLVKHTNHVSQNFYAESILKFLALKKNGFGSTIGGADIIRKYMRRKRINTRGFHQHDGSGLSRFDGVTSRQLTELLSAYTRDSVFFNTLYNTMAVAGRSGTLRGLCFGTRAEGNVHAKSGYMSRVRSYAGYVTTRSGELLAFSMMANNFDCSPVQMRYHFEKLMALMADIE